MPTDNRDSTRPNQVCMHHGCTMPATSCERGYATCAQHDAYKVFPGASFTGAAGSPSSDLTSHPILCHLLPMRARYAIDQIVERTRAGVSLREAESDVRCFVGGIDDVEWAQVVTVAEITTTIHSAAIVSAMAFLVENALQSFALAGELVAVLCPETKERIRSEFDDIGESMQVHRYRAATAEGLHPVSHAGSAEARMLREMAGRKVLEFLAPLLAIARAGG